MEDEENDLCRANPSVRTSSKQQTVKPVRALESSQHAANGEVMVSDGRCSLKSHGVLCDRSGNKGVSLTCQRGPGLRPY